MAINPIFAKFGPTVTTTNWKFPTTTGQIGSSPQIAWGSTANITAAGSAYATCNLVSAGQFTRSLRANTFNFAAESIPASATIIRLDIEVGRNMLINGGAPSIYDSSVTWVDDYTAAAIQGLSQAASAAWIETDIASPEVISYSWTTPAQGALTKAILEGANFAVLLQAKRNAADSAGDATARVEYIKCRASYY